MPEIVLPWKGKDTGFTLTEVKVFCNCGSPLTSVKGNIYEMCGVIEMRTIGFCLGCRHIVPCRSRVYPKTGVFAQEKNGKWEEGKMITFKQMWFKESSRLFFKMVLAFGIWAALYLLLSVNTPNLIYLRLIAGLTITAFISGLIGYFITKGRNK